MADYTCVYYERRIVVTSVSKEAAQRRAAFLLGIRHSWQDVTVVKIEELQQ